MSGPSAPSVWVVLRDLDGPDPEADVFASEEAANDHIARLLAEGAEPASMNFSEETVYERSFLSSPEEVAS